MPWKTNSVDNYPSIICPKLKTSLHEMNQHYWLNDENSSSKCDSFKQFKNRVKLEKYQQKTGSRNADACSLNFK